MVFSGDLPFYREIHEELVRELFEKGYARKVRFIIQRPNPDALAWSNAIRKVIAYDASLIIVYGSGAARAALYESSSIPIIYAAVYKPEESGIKGENIRGVGYKVPVSSIIRYLRKTGNIKKIGVLYSDSEPGTKTQYNDVRDVCKTLSLDVVKIPVKRAREIGRKLKLLSYDSLFLTSSALINKYFPDYIMIFRKKSVPLVAIMQGLEEYSLITLSTDPRKQGAILAKNLIQFINNRDIDSIKNTDILKNSLTFNMKLAIELGLDIPVELLTESDRVIK
ncbi:hypothetical protein MNBD_NITROSPIRAE03-942 [hydrothermal vent metagenome]|uniref:ABC transporter substrate-binding protein n=1 Tax=hydrothermal vent metagenome TaxID=652676 RepID=A0A3B1D9C6_9ZZZZ